MAATILNDVTVTIKNDYNDTTSNGTQVQTEMVWGSRQKNKKGWAMIGKLNEFDYYFRKQVFLHVLIWLQPA